MAPTVACVRGTQCGRIMITTLNRRGAQTPFVCGASSAVYGREWSAMICMGALTDCQRLLQDSGSPAQLALSSSLASRPPSSDLYGRVAVIRLGGASASHVWGCAVISQWFVWEGSQQGTDASRSPLWGSDLSGARSSHWQSSLWEARSHLSGRRLPVLCTAPAPVSGSDLYGGSPSSTPISSTFYPRDLRPACDFRSLGSLGSVELILTQNSNRKPSGSPPFRSS